MDFFEVLDKRRSIRAFTDEDVRNDEIETILSVVMSCPTAGNLQAYKVFVFRDAKRRLELSKAAMGQPSIAEAPVVLVFAAEPSTSARKYGKKGAEFFAVQDATVACTFAHLAATALGLGSVWIGAFDEAKVIEAGTLTGGSRPVALLPIGHPAESPPRTPRRKKEEAVTKDY